MLEFVENEEHYAAVVERLISTAEKRLDIVTATVKALTVLRSGKGKDIARFFDERARCGVHIRLLHSGVPSEFFLRASASCRLANNPNFRMRRCPRVHQKTILSDGSLLYIGSANLTGAGLGLKSDKNRNFEVGILTDELFLIDRADSLFELIWCGDMCEKCGRKAICPIPLEEP